MTAADHAEPGGAGRATTGDRPAGSASSFSHSGATSLLAWLVPQLLVLAVAAARVQLSTGSHRPAEGLAVEELLIVQFAIAGMLFPAILGDLFRLVAAAITAAPLLQLAGFLAATPTRDLALSWCCLALWLAALAMIGTAIPPRSQLLAVAVANLTSLGGLLLWYLESDFAGPAALAHFVPLPALLLFLRHQAGIRLPLSSTAILAGFSLVALLMARRNARHVRVGARISSPQM